MCFITHENVSMKPVTENTFSSKLNYMIPGELKELSEQECLELLKQKYVGRIGITVSALPVILPVNYKMIDKDIIIRTDPGAKLSNARRREIVAFEVDGIDTTYHTGWSVLIQGYAEVITDPDLLKQAQQLALNPWVKGKKEHFIIIHNQLMTGRYIISPNPRNSQ